LPCFDSIRNGDGSDYPRVDAMIVEGLLGRFGVSGAPNRCHTTAGRPSNGRTPQYKAIAGDGNLGWIEATVLALATTYEDCG
jgi:hypothetical protein